MKTELIEMVLERNPAVSGPPDLLNRCVDPPCDFVDASSVERIADRALQRISGATGAWVVELPETSYLRVRSGNNAETDASYTLVHNRAHTNVAAMFGEDKRLIPEEDTLTVVRGYLGSYPNFLFEAEAADIRDFTRALTSVKNETDFEKFVERWGIRRTSRRFWNAVDWIHQDARRRNPHRSRPVRLRPLQESLSILQGE